ncbi:collagen-like protein [Pseudomonas aeruginosa]|nr:collagen-like protein [Pseudomonas aeruginosa]
MRKRLFGLLLIAPLCWAEAAMAADNPAPAVRQQGIGGTVRVQPNSVMRLPKRAQELRRQRVEIGEDGALLIPLQVSVLRIEELRMARNARIGVAPGEGRISIEVISGHLADGSIIAAPGATGTFRQRAGNGRDLTLRLQAVEVENLLLDARGGVGAPGYDGLDGASGKASGCFWGSAQKGGDGQSGSDGGPGGAGGRIRLEVPGDFPVERLQTRLEGGVGGAGGKAGKPGAADPDNGCWIYSVDAGRAGRGGQDGANGADGSDGSLDVVRF